MPVNQKQPDRKINAKLDKRGQHSVHPRGSVFNVISGGLEAESLNVV
jgi:hypothetical protein